MERAPLTRARARIRENPSDPAAYEAAAEDFSKATQGIHDPEALRILTLLEENHRQLARIVRSRSEHKGETENVVQPPSSDQPVPEPAPEEPRAPASGANATLGQSPTALKEAVRAPQSSNLPQKHAREPSSTLASNLATARGIPQKGASLQPPRQQRASPNLVSPNDPLTAKATSNLGESVQQGRSRALHDRERSKAVEDRGHSDQKAAGYATPRIQATDSPDRAATEDPFAQFYSTFGGLLSKLSAPLAYAGLPLVAEESSPSALRTSASANVSRRTASDAASVTPASESNTTAANVNKIFSQAALRAVQDSNGPIQSFGNKGGMNDSFYVVPPAGGTISYAGVVSRTDRQYVRRMSQGSAFDDPGEDDGLGDQFVDARESPNSPKANEALGHDYGNMQRVGSKKTQEELELENKSLKELAASLSNRLYMWEKSAQSQSMALHQSIRTLQPIPQTHADDTASASQQTKVEGLAAAEKKIKELEEQVETAHKEVQRYSRENEKLKSVVLRYRERWEKLKEGAKGRVRRDSAETTPDAQKTEAS